jgi:deazaflavin-dependent oxidoreductase (nitroreductase family)
MDEIERNTTMDEQVRQALEQDQTIDITTTGRKSGKPRRIEIWFHNLSGRLYITGTPGRRDWYANMRANPRFTFHLKRSTQANLPAIARPILDEKERQRVLARVLNNVGRDPSQLDEWVKNSPLVEVELEAR